MWKVWFMRKSHECPWSFQNDFSLSKLFDGFYDTLDSQIISISKSIVFLEAEIIGNLM